jgi:CheY-like chemotaxis protein
MVAALSLFSFNEADRRAASTVGDLREAGKNMYIPSHSTARATTGPALTYTSSALRILVVEDNAALLQLFGEILRAAGHFTGLSASSQDGLARFRAEPWHLVCTNRDRRDMDGHEFAREIKRLSPSTPVVMLTRIPPPQRHESIDAVLQKPFTCDALAETITSGLEASWQETRRTGREAQEGRQRCRQRE